MSSTRRVFIQKSALAAAAAGLGLSCDRAKQVSAGDESAGTKSIIRNRIGVSTYSFWQFNGPKENSPIEDCIEKAAAMGFDGIEVSCGIAEDGFSTIRGDMQTETILATLPMYKN